VIIESVNEMLSLCLYPPSEVRSFVEMILKFRSIEAKVYPLSMRCFPKLSKLVNVLVSAVITITLSFLSGITCCDFRLLKLQHNAIPMRTNMYFVLVMIISISR
jgi:uncharacterized membrane protein